jgi:hypothetical protein
MMDSVTRVARAQRDGVVGVDTEPDAVHSKCGLTGRNNRWNYHKFETWAKTVAQKEGGGRREDPRSKWVNLSNLHDDNNGRCLHLRGKRKYLKVTRHPRLIFEACSFRL